MIIVEGSSSEPRRLELHVTRDGQIVSRRRFDPGPERCSALHAAVGFTIALIIKNAQEDALERNEQSTASALPLRRWSVSASGLGAYRPFYAATPGAELSAGALLGQSFEARVSVLGLLGIEVPLPDDAGRFHAVLLGLRVEGCGRAVVLGPVHGGVCLGLLAGALHTVGLLARDATRSTVPYIALAGALELELELSQRWSLTLKALQTYLTHSVRVGVVDELDAPVSQRALPKLVVAIALGPRVVF